MKCSKCSSYSKMLGRCRLGYINPSKWSMKKFEQTIKIMGLSYVCNHSPWKKKYLAKTNTTKED